MTRVREGGFPAGQGREADALALGLEQLQRLQGVMFVIQRHGRFVFGVTVAVDEGSVFFLDVSAVWQQDGAQIAGGGCGMHAATIALAVKQGQVTAVV